MFYSLVIMYLNKVASRFVLLTAAVFLNVVYALSPQKKNWWSENSISYKAGSRPCPCNVTTYCNRIETMPKKEIFVFSVNNHNWQKYDWNKVTSVVEFGYHDNNLVCYAHSKGVRVLSNADIQVQDLTNHTKRHTWIQQHLEMVVNNFLDGINIDFEAAIPKDRTDLQHGLTKYISELKSEFKQHLPSTLVTVDVAWNCYGVDDRFYDYKSIADASDFMFVMAYDERSQIYGDCIAWANSAHNSTLYGVNSYLHIGIPPAKLVLGVPWYGYRYPCLTYDPSSHRCWLKHVRFRGVNCSDAAGKEVGYGTITNTYLPKSSTGKMWDKVAESPYFSLNDSHDNQVVQFWYDDPESLLTKYRLVSSLDLRGLGMWNADSLDYSDLKMIQKMWGAIPQLN